MLFNDFLIITTSAQVSSLNTWYYVCQVNAVPLHGCAEIFF